MKANELSKKSTKKLNTELISLLREKFNLRMQAASGHLKKTHMLKQARRNLARVKTFLTEKVGVK